MVFPQEIFENMFKNHYYFSQEFADLMNNFLGKVSLSEVGGKKIYIYDNKKIIAWSPHSLEEKRLLTKRKIQYFSIENKDNYSIKNSSYIEYACMPHKPYSEIRKGYKKNFRKQVIQARGFNLEWRPIEKEEVEEIIAIHLAHLRHIKSITIPLFDFKKALQIKGANIYFIEHNKQKVGFSFFYENKDNIYASLGATHPNFYDLRINNFRYDSLFRYASEKGKNVHFGIGVHNSAFDKFKLNAGLTLLKTDTKYHDLLTRISLISMKTPLRHLANFYFKRNPNLLYQNLLPYT